MKQLGMDGLEHELPNDLIDAEVVIPHKMVLLYGEKQGKICGKCKHLNSYLQGNKWYHRCVKLMAVSSNLVHMTMHEQACNKYEKRNGVQE